MLIVLHESLLRDLQADSPNRGEAIEGLESLARIRRDGRHLLFGGRRTFEAIIGTEGLSELARATYKVVYQRLAEVKAFSEIVSRRIELVGHTYGPLSSRVVGDITIVQVPVGMFDTELGHQPVLMGENLTDVRIFVRMAHIFAHKMKTGPVPLSYEAVGGGGSTTVDQYLEYQNRSQRLCLCIVDSDKKSPQGALGSTAKSLDRANQAHRPLSEIAILNVRELENVIPPVVLSQIPGIDPVGVQDIERLVLSSVSETRGYIDLKRGTAVGKMLSLPATSSDRRYWVNLWHGLATELQSVSRQCADRGECPTPHACTCIINRGLGDNLLSHAAGACEKISPKKLGESLDTLAEAEWERIGSVVLSWCCASPRLRAA